MESKMDFEEIKNNVGSNIRALRKSHEETQEDLANAINISKESIAKIEQGNVCLTLENQCKIAEHYHVSHDYILKGDGYGTILESLESFISFKLQDCTVGNQKLQYPQLEINQFLFNYLLQSARAEQAKNIPDKIRKLWHDEEKKNFFDSMKNNVQKTIRLALVKTELIFPDSNKEDWKQTDLLREIDKSIDSLFVESNSPND